MTKILRSIFILTLFILISSQYNLYAQSITSASGIVKDSISGEPLSYVSVIFKNSTIGAMTDDNGEFKNLHNNKGLTIIEITSLGYETKTIHIKEGKENNKLEILLAPTSYVINDVVIKPTKEKYSRKNNPAVELIKKVIEHKDENRIENKDEYQTECYKKLTLSLDNFNPNFDKNKLTRKFSFIKNYLDTSEFNGKPILTLSVRESISDIYYRKSPKTTKTIQKAFRQQGVDKTIDDSGSWTANLDEIFQGINIFNNNINLMLNRFVSPLSSTLATTYYKFYIMDTIMVDNQKCIDLGFVPANSESFGFTGNLYITLDGKYSIKKARLNTPVDINLNWVKRLRIDQEFKQLPDSSWVLAKENTYANLYIISGTQQFYAHQLRTFEKYKPHIEKSDSIFKLIGTVHEAVDATEKTDTFWINNRHIPLKQKESVLDELLAQMRKIPVFNVAIKTAEILISGYITTHKDKDKSKFDFGPMNTTFSANRLEGFRMRVGGMTTANLNPRWFANGYIAYGVDDRKLKYNATLTHSFNKKKYHVGETPINNLSVMHEYDVYTPGQDFLFTSKDNMFVAIKVGEPITKMQYIRKSVLQYDKEWLNGLSIKGWLKHENNEAAGTLQYKKLDATGNNFTNITDFTTSEVGLQLRFAPGERAYNGREGKASIFNLSKDAPVFRVSHQIGFNNVLGSDYYYNHTELSAEKRIWLSSFGHIDAQVKAGKVWNKVPFPLLILPNTNQSITIQPEAFNMMNALEFVSDQYVSFFLTYYLKGWIFNRIPGLKWLKFREVLSISGFYGSLTDKNNPLVSPNGLFALPDGTSPIGNVPYLEASIGIENIFKILRIDYYRRLTYLDKPNIKKGGVRIALRFTF